jgi:two-component system, NarL family, response regulator DesR
VTRWFAPPSRCGPTSPWSTSILKHYSAGQDPHDIAADLNLSYGTVRNYLASAVTKLGARNRVDAIRIAREAAWL